MSNSNTQNTTSEDRILATFQRYRANAAAHFALERARHYRLMLRMLDRSGSLEEAKQVARILMRENGRDAVRLAKGGVK